MKNREDFQDDICFYCKHLSQYYGKEAKGYCKQKQEDKGLTDTCEDFEIKDFWS